MPDPSTNEQWKAAWDITTAKIQELENKIEDLKIELELHKQYARTYKKQMQSLATRMLALKNKEPDQ